MDTILSNLIRGPRLRGALGLQGDTSEPVYSNNYEWLELRATGVRATTGELLTKGARNQYIRLEPTESVLVAKPYKALVSVNPALMEYGTGPLLYILDASNGRVHPGAYLQLRRDLDLTAPDAPTWVVRLGLLT